LPIVRNRLPLALVGVLLCAHSLTACLKPTREVHGDGTTPPTVTAAATSQKFDKTVVFYSDSIGWEARDALAARLAESNIALDYHGYPGMALCDYLNEIPSAVRTNRAAVLVIEFSGNVFTPCMEGVPGDEVYKKYQADGQQLLTALAAEVSTTILFASAPTPLDPRRQTAEINAAWQQFSTLYPSRVRFVNAAEALNDASGKAAMTLPCLDVEGPDKGCVDGRIKVRSDDGIHFCPTNNPDPKNFNCVAAYASGAVRYAYAIADGVLSAIANPASP
jgi:hypothetical protein